MIIFTNPGLIDLAAVTTLGVSVKQPGSFGRFGTGLKFAVATILRGGGEVILFRGEERWEFVTESVTIRDIEFQKIAMHCNTRMFDNHLQLGITTQLGRDWEPWMVLRELGCNALDEHGSFEQQSGDDEYIVLTEPDKTIIAVSWPALEDAYAERESLFLAERPATEPILATAAIRVLPGESQYLYYRGIRVYKLPTSSSYTYDLLDEQRLTEDRTLAASYSAGADIARVLVQSTDRALIRMILSNDDAWEFTLDYDWHATPPSREFLDEALNLRAQHKALPSSVRDLLLRRMREHEIEPTGAYRRALDDKLQYAIDILAKIGLRFPVGQDFVLVPELPGDGMLTMLESGRVYYIEALLTQSARKVTEELLTRWAEMSVEGYDQLAMAVLLVPVIVRSSMKLKDDEELAAEDERIAADEDRFW